MGTTSIQFDYEYIINALTQKLIRDLWWDDSLEKFSRKFLRRSIAKGTKPIVGIGLGESSENKQVLHFLSTLDPEDLHMQDILSAEGWDELQFEITKTGPILAAGKVAPTERAQGGDSIQREDGATGTFGCLVDDNSGSVILTCLHVLATLDDQRKKREILWSGHRIGVSHTFEPIVLGPDGNNEVDAGLCKPDDQKIVTTGLRRLGRISGSLRNPPFGLRVKKAGAASGITEGAIWLKNLSAAVAFEGGHQAIFLNQLGIMGAGKHDRFAIQGDSGALVVNENNVAVGLLSAVSGGIDLAYANPIETVFSKLVIRLA